MSMGLTPQQMAVLGMGTPGAPGPPLMAGQDPRSQYLAQALAQMSQQPQGSAQGLGANLLAEALDRYGMQKGQGQQAFQPGQMTPAYLDPSQLPNFPQNIQGP